MKIVIEKVVSREAECFVYFSTGYGRGYAKWEDEAPQTGKEYFVELGISDVLSRNKDIVVSEKDKYSLEVGRIGVF